MSQTTKPSATQKYLSIARSFIPLALIIGLGYLFNTIPAFQYVEWVLVGAGICFVIYFYANTIKLTNNLRKGENLPKIYTDFPIYETSEQEYRLTRKKMETFILSVEAEQHVQVELSAGEINSLNNKGKTAINSGTDLSMMLPEYYEICNGTIYQYSITWMPFRWEGLESIIYEITFLKQDGNYASTQKKIEVNGKKLPLNKQLSYALFPLGGKLFDIILRLDKTMDWEESMQLVITKIQEIEVVQDKLILRT